MTPECAKQLVDDLRPGKDVVPTRGADRCAPGSEASRVLAGFPDGRADEGPSAGPASRWSGLELSRSNGGRRRPPRRHRRSPASRAYRTEEPGSREDSNK